MALSAADVRRFHAEGKRAALIGIENGRAKVATCRCSTSISNSERAIWACCRGHSDIGEPLCRTNAKARRTPSAGASVNLDVPCIERANALGMVVDDLACGHDHRSLLPLPARR